VRWVGSVSGEREYRLNIALMVQKYTEENIAQRIGCKFTSGAARVFRSDILNIFLNLKFKSIY